VKLAWALLLLLNSACQAPADRPEDPVWGKQSCASCAMLVSAPRFAAQLVPSRGEARYFDDVGCLAAYLAQRANAGGEAWVREERGGWVKAESSRFESGAKTPMDYGFELSPTGTLDWPAVRAAVSQRLAQRTQP
jgi:hypothetical protein